MSASIKSRAREFIESLVSLQFEDAFNPYAEACPSCDVRDAAAIRRRNLSLVLDSAIRTGIDSVWIGRDLGYRGGRRTGLALTDEAHLAAYGSLFGGLPLARATKGPAIAERTASVIWQVLTQIDRPIFLWNVFPLHPHEHGDPMSNRCHTRAERHACRPLLLWLLDVLQPRTIVAIGRDAQFALADLDIEAEKVRHPSYGGQAEFVAGACALYDLDRSELSHERSLF